jgi:HSP20 family protein
MLVKFSNNLPIAGELDKLVADFLSPNFWENQQVEGNGVLSPRVDISEDAKSVFIHAELPGLKKEDVKVTVKDGVLVIKGEKKQEEKTEGKNYHRIERRYGTFSRSFTLGDHVDAENINANFENGVLSLTLPKVEVRKDEKEIAIR